MRLDKTAKTSWETMVTELQVFRDEEPGAIGGVDEMLLARYLAGQCDTEEQELVRQAASSSAEVSDCLEVVRGALDSVSPAPVSPPRDPSPPMPSSRERPRGIAAAVGNWVVAASLLAILAGGAYALVSIKDLESGQREIAALRHDQERAVARLQDQSLAMAQPAISALTETINKLQSRLEQDESRTLAAASQPASGVEKTTTTLQVPPLRSVEPPAQPPSTQPSLSPPATLRADASAPPAAAAYQGSPAAVAETRTVDPAPTIAHQCPSPMTTAQVAKIEPPTATAYQRTLAAVTPGYAPCTTNYSVPSTNYYPPSTNYYPPSTNYYSAPAVSSAVPAQPVPTTACRIPSMAATGAPALIASPSPTPASLAVPAVNYHVPVATSAYVATYPTAYVGSYATPYVPSYATAYSSAYAVPQSPIIGPSAPYFGTGSAFLPSLGAGLPAPNAITYPYAGNWTPSRWPSR